MAASVLTQLSGHRDEPTVEGESSLGPREHEVLGLVAEGATNKDIAAALFISENTVKTHLRNIMEKLHVERRTQAAAYAIRAGLVRPASTPDRGDEPGL